MTWKPEDFVPQVFETEYTGTYGTMLVRLTKCGACERPMVEPLHDYQPFPSYYRASFEAQCKAAGWAINGYATMAVGDKIVAICRGCKKDDVASFKCALCEQTRKSSEVQETAGIGDGAEYLCKPCYETTPAKQWDEKVEELEKAHRYDGC